MTHHKHDGRFAAVAAAGAVAGFVTVILCAGMASLQLNCEAPGVYASCRLMNATSILLMSTIIACGIGFAILRLANIPKHSAIALAAGLQSFFICQLFVQFNASFELKMAIMVLLSGTLYLAGTIFWNYWRASLVQKVCVALGALVVTALLTFPHAVLASGYSYF